MAGEGPQPVAAVLGLGANLGERAARMRDALARLAAHPAIRLLAVSRLYETAPWGVTDQPAFSVRPRTPSGTQKRGELPPS